MPHAALRPPVLFLLLVCAMALLSPANDLRAAASCDAVCYVAVDGNDGNAGTIDAPFKTIQAAVIAVKEYGTIYVGPGTYTGSTIIAHKPVSLRGAQTGTPRWDPLRNPAAESTLIGDPGEPAVTVDALSTVIDGFTFAPGSTGVLISNNARPSVTVINNVFVNLDTAVDVPVGATAFFDLTISDNYFEGGTRGVYAYGSTDRIGTDVAVLRNVFDGVTTAVVMHGMQLARAYDNTFVDVFGPIDFQHVDGRIGNNHFSDSGPIQVSGSVQDLGGDIFNPANDIFNNTLVRPVGTVFLVRSTERVTITGNSVTGFGAAGPAIDVHDSATNVTIQDNTIAGTGSTGILVRNAEGDDFIANGIGMYRNSIHGLGVGIELQDPAAVARNTITGASTAVKVTTQAASTGATVNQNAFPQSATGIDNTSGVELDGTCNWWGHYSGPGGVGPGTGAAVSANVRFQPWLAIADFDAPCDPSAITIAAFLSPPQPPEGYLPGETVTVEYVCVPGENALTRCELFGTNGANLDTSTPGKHSFTVEGEDTSGKIVTQSIDYHVLTLPGVTIATPGDGATYPIGANVAADFACTPGSEPLASCTAPVETGSAIDTSTLGDHTFTVTATDDLGYTATHTVTYTVVEAPSVTITSPAEGATYPRGASVIADFACTPGSAPIASCIGTAANGSAIDTSNPGDRTFSVTATDELGQSTTATVTYTVVPAPVIHRVTPASASPGAEVTIRGVHFLGTTSVTFGGLAAEFTVVDDQTIRAIVPADAPAGSTAIVVSIAAGPGATAHTFTITHLHIIRLGFRWTLMTWVGVDGLAISDALRGEGPNSGGSNAWDAISAIYAFDAAAGEWLAFFPSGIGVPGANNLGVLHYGAAYWVALAEGSSKTWTVVLGADPAE